VLTLEIYKLDEQLQRIPFKGIGEEGIMTSEINTILLVNG
jgi:hypothetical protein